MMVALYLLCGICWGQDVRAPEFTKFDFVRERIGHKVLVEGTARAKVVRYTANPDYFEAEVERIAETLGAKEEIEALACRSGNSHCQKLRFRPHVGVEEAEPLCLGRRLLGASPASMGFP